MINNSEAPYIIVAIDSHDAQSANELVKQFNPKLCRLKIGSILFTREGPALIESWQKMGFSVFLDLKFHDIPQTVAGACRMAAALGVWMVNVHLVGGRRMLVAAQNEIAKLPAHARPLLTGVTVLTSLEESDLIEVGVDHKIKDWVLQLALLGESVGLDGVVCSPEEISMLRQRVNPQFLLVTPGIRLTADRVDDQRRMMTPEAALSKGANYLVIGRPITQAKSPIAALQQIISEITN